MEKLENIEAPLCVNPEEHRKKNLGGAILFCNYYLKEGEECLYRVKLSIMPGEYACVYKDD